MAGNTGGSDFQLVVGANQSLSFSEMKKDIEAVITKINSKPQKIKVGITIDKSKGYSDLIKDINSISDRYNGRTSEALKLKIGIDKTYIEKQYKQVITSLARGEFANLNGLSLIDDKSLSKMKLEIQQAKQLIAEYQNSITTGTTKFSGVDTSNVIKDVVTLEQANQRIATVKNTIESSATTLKSIYKNDQFPEMEAKYKSLMASAKEYMALEDKDKLNQIEKLSLLEQETAVYKNNLSEIKSLQTANAGVIKRETDAIKERNQEEKSTINDLNKQLNLVQTIQNYLKGNTRIKGTQYENQLNTLLGNLQTGDYDSKTLKGYETVFKQIKTDITDAGLAGKSLFDVFSSGVKKFSSWFGVSQLVMSGVRGIKQMISTVTELDTAMTELRKVTDLTEKEYENFGSIAANIAKQVGATIADTINSTADFARLGYNIDESAQLAEAALVYKNVGDGIDDIGESSESIISTIKAFNIEATNAMGIVDRFNKVGNEFAISSEGIGTALKKSAAALATSGNSLEESIGLITGMNAVVQNPEQVGTAVKTLTMYLRAAKAEAEEAGESTDGMANSVSELQGDILALTNGKVDIMFDANNFKSTYQIIKEISEVWESMAEVDQAALLKLIAGKRNANVVTSLITNFKDAEDAMKAASEASGSALAENEKYLDSIEGKKARLKASFETLSGDIFESDTLKTTISTLTTIVDLVDKLVSTLGTIPTIAGTISAALSFKNIGRTKMFVLINMNMPIVIIVLCGYTQFRYYGYCNTIV